MMITHITHTIDLGASSYPIHIGTGVLDTLPGWESLTGHSTVVIVTDSNVWGHWGQRLTAALAARDITAHTIILPPGEQNKSLAGLGQVYDGFAQYQLRRNGLVVAFGGGVIGDLAGFAAATWMRGVPYVQIPTTLLAQVDSSVGGKTAIDLPAGKNLAGAFHQPKLVLIDPETLTTLPEREMRCGMAEVIKYGAICDGSLLEKLVTPPTQAELTAIIAACCRHKGDLVQQDELDTGVRMLLNFGHTFGHGVESLGHYTRWNHGEAVAIGMILAAAVGEELRLSAAGCTEKLRRVLAANGLDTRCPYTAAELIPHMALDKKSGGATDTPGVQMVALGNLGQSFTQFVSFDTIQIALERTAALWQTNTTASS